MITISCTNIIYDDGYDPSNLVESVCSYAARIGAHEAEVVSQRVFDYGFTPTQVTVNGRKGRRVGCALAGDGMAYVVFDLDQEEGEDEEEDEEVEEGEGEEEEVDEGEDMAVDDE